MLLCKELSDISSDLPIQDYQMMVQFIKGVNCTVCNGKSTVVKELSEMLIVKWKMARKILDAPCHKMLL